MLSTKVMAQLSSIHTSEITSTGNQYNNVSQCDVCVLSVQLIGSDTEDSKTLH